MNAHVPGAATEILPADDGCLPADENLRSVRCEKRAAHKPTTRYPGHAHSHVRLHLDNSSILHHQRYLGQPFSSHPHEKANAFATEAKKGGKIGKDPKEGDGGVDGQLCLAS